MNLTQLELLHLTLKNPLQLVNLDRDCFLLSRKYLGSKILSLPLQFL